MKYASFGDRHLAGWHANRVPGYQPALSAFPVGFGAEAHNGH